MDLVEMFEGWQQASSTTAKMTLSILVDLMQKQDRDITFGTYAKGILKASGTAPADVQHELTKLVYSIANKYAKVVHKESLWSGYDFTAPEQVFANESLFKDALYECLLDFLFSKGYQEAGWAIPIREFTSTAKWKLEPYMA